MENYFKDLELEVRKYLSDPELRTKVLEDLAQEILRQMVDRQVYQDNNGGHWPPASVRSIRFTGAIVAGVASVIADELGKNAEPKKPSKKQIKKQEWSDQADSKILLRLSTRAQGVCQEMGLLTLEEMRAASDVDYLRVPRCGKGTLHEIKQFLARDGEPTAEELRDKLRFDLQMDAALDQALLNRSSQT
jgi:hypothetical protein